MVTPPSVALPLVDRFPLGLGLCRCHWSACALCIWTCLALLGSWVDGRLERMYDTRPVCSPADPLEDPGWWARLYADLEADGMPEEEIPAGRMESYLAAFPEEAPLWTLPKGFTTAAGEDLARSPGAELTVAVEELLAV